jgi:predicted ATPase/predicted negative regulator of RcsB-dependent stress response
VTAVRITLLGGFAAETDGQAVPGGAWRLRKARELVKLLALARGHRLHREQVMEALWPGRDLASAANNLNQVVHAARRALGAEAIEVRDELLLLHADVDVELFEDAAAAATDPSAARYALSLYAGELLPENRYDDWAETSRAALERLRDELAELAGSAPTGVAARPLPAATSSFVGRGRELGELEGLLGRTRLLTLSGAGGAGKTRLAVELARRCAPTFEDGAALVELAELEHGAHVATAVAQALDVRALPGQEPLDAVSRFLASRRLLLVLDNCEHVLDDATRTAIALLATAPELVVVATSRTPLRVPGEVVFRVPSLALPALASDAEALQRSEAVALFVERAAGADPAFRLDDRNAAAVAAICIRLDGLPLALELAAARLGALAPEALAERLDDRFRLLRAASAAAPTRQQTLTATLDWSYELLGEPERALLRSLAVFAAGFDLEAAEAVAGPDTVELLARLVEESLVVAEETPAGRRYRLLETVRLYAADRLFEAGERRDAVLRHAGWALAVAERAAGESSLDREAPNLAAALDTFLVHDPERALRLCVALRPFWLRRIDLAEGRRRIGGALAAAPEPSALRARALLVGAEIDFRAGELDRVRAQTDEALAVARSAGDRRVEWEALQMRGELGVGSDAMADARAAFEQALGRAREEGWAAEIALGVYSLGACRWFVGDHDGADVLLAESGDLFEEAGDAGALDRSPLMLTEFRAAEAGRPGLRVAFEDTLQPFVPLVRGAATGHVLASRAAVARVRGDRETADRLLDEAAAVFERLGDTRGSSLVLVRRGYLQLDADEIDDARRSFQEALALRRAVGDRRGIGMVLSGLGHVETTAGRFAAAERHVEAACDLFRRAGDRWGLTSSLWRAADLAVARGRPAEARVALEDALEIVRPTARVRWRAHTLARLGEVLALEGRVEEARRLLAEARDGYASHGDPVGATAVGERLAALAEPVQSARKAASRTTRGDTPATRRKE